MVPDLNIVLALVVNAKKFTYVDPNVTVPPELEVIWGLIRPKNQISQFKKLILCSFYLPPNTAYCSYRTSKHSINIGADINAMNFQPILNCGLKLRQIVNKATRRNKTLDVIFTNLGSYYKSPVIAPQIEPDNPRCGEASDYSVPVCIPHSDKFSRPERTYKLINYRPMPATKMREFDDWIVQ